MFGLSVKTVYLDVSLYFWRTKVSTVDFGEKRYTKLLYLIVTFTHPPVAVVGRVESKRRYLFYVFLTGNISLLIEISTAFC
jgi:hypothetical protein